MRILAIEDNPADRGILRELLVDIPGSAFELCHAGTVSEAKSLIAEDGFDCIILDLGLPDSQGLDSLKSVRSLTPTMPIIVLTGFDDEETGLKAFHEGAQDYLIKGQINGPSLARSIRYARERNQIEQELVRKNAELDLINEELISAEDELRHNLEELKAREIELEKNQEKLSEALDEKEVLLSEIHHRVKNNLAAFISLLSLEGSYDNSPAGLAMKKDLQNRARSMALIHETLYRTRNFSRVDIGMYLSTLVDQIISSYRAPESFERIVEVHGITLDIMRATPLGLIVNEIVTNSLKYAFPKSFNCAEKRNEPCTIRIGLVKEDRTYVLTVSDNGVGLPEEIDIKNSRTLGLKLVYFLSKHQLKAKLEIERDKGTRYTFRFS